MKYASKTKVPVSRSKVEVERILSKYGADQFMYGTDEVQAVIMFRYDGKHIKYIIPYPEIDGKITDRQYDQAIRQLWRALVLVIKAKLEAVASGIATFEDEFLSNIVMPDGKTVGEHTLPKVRQAYLTGKMPKLLPGVSG